MLRAAALVEKLADAGPGSYRFTYAVVAIDAMGRFGDAFAAPMPLPAPAMPAIDLPTATPSEAEAKQLLSAAGIACAPELVVADAEVMAITPPGDIDTGDAGGFVVLRISSDDALEVARALDFARQVRVVTRPAGEDG